jgi:hypothetical protein
VGGLAGHSRAPAGRQTAWWQMVSVRQPGVVRVTTVLLSCTAWLSG